MRDLIKAIIREEVEKFDTLKLIRDYKGSNVFMNSVKTQLEKKGTLTKNQIDAAIGIFKTNFYKDSLIYDSLQKHYQSKMKELGIEAYLNLMKTSKKNFLKPSTGGITLLILKKVKNREKLNFLFIFPLSKSKEF